MVDLRTAGRPPAGPSGSKRNKGVSQGERITRIEEKIDHLASSADLKEVSHKVTTIDEKITLEVAKIDEKISHLASSADLEVVRHEVMKVEEKISKDLEVVSHKVTTLEEKISKNFERVSHRVTTIEEKITHLASSADLEKVRHEVIKVDEKITREVTNLKVWILAGTLGGIAVFSGIMVSIGGLFFS